jgi:hypothetical protein
MFYNHQYVFIVNRKNPTYYDDAFGKGALFSKASVDQALRNGIIAYGERINVVRYDKEQDQVSDLDCVARACVYVCV